MTLVERKTRFTVATMAAYKTARAVTDAICDYLKPYRDRVLTLTCDNGREFACHEEIARGVSDLLCMGISPCGLNWSFIEPLVV